MTPNEIIYTLREQNMALTMKNDELKKLAEKKADAERNFNIAMAKKSLELKTEGQSVTLIKDLARGDKNVADLKFKHDVAEAIYHACRESIKDVRTSIDTHRSLLTWLREELHRS